MPPTLTKGKINRWLTILAILVPVSCFTQDTSGIIMSEGVKLTIDAPKEMEYKNTLLGKVQKMKKNGVMKFSTLVPK